MIFILLLRKFEKMSDKFCLKAELRETDKTAVFQSESGEDYFVNYNVNKFGEIVLSVEWITLKQNLVKVELFTAEFEPISSQMHVGYENRATFKLIAPTKPDSADECNLMFIITIIPYVNIGDISISSKHKEEALSENDDKIKDLSEDMLIGLALDMRDLLIHGDLSDVVITNGNHAVKVHAAILSARSSVFRKFFKDPSHNRVFTIAHASAEGLQDMLSFIYSSFIKIKDMDRAEELYMLAHEYEIPDLREVCSLYMSNCTVDRALRTLILADKNQDDQLRGSSIDFIVRNLSEVKSDEKWQSFAEENVDLVSEIFSNVSSTLETDALHAFMSRLSSKKIKM